ncbi:MAG: glycosyltransferase [Anaerolineae bacterium]|nr:glycosyltransferase [Anaerolineae bacterium]
MKTVSVVIPAYNRQAYIAGTIDSVLAQTVPDVELIVVDDGSTDATPAIVSRYGDTVRLIRQENMGAAAARNCGALAATGQFVAFLDSDDQWDANFLSEMLAVAARWPQAAALYSFAQMIDADGKPLLQKTHNVVYDPDELYAVLLRANFLLPSTMLCRRAALLEVGLFDVSLRRLQDWDLWLRMLRADMMFVGVQRCLVRYRAHPHSLSADTVTGNLAALAIAEKHFGPDDGHPEQWSAHKRLAYGGVYRFQAIDALLRHQDWSLLQSALIHALRVDPTLATDESLFYELALGTQPVGRRTPAAVRKHLSGFVRQIEIVLTALETSGLPLKICREASGTAYYALSLVAYNAGEPALSRQCATKAVRLRPDLVRERLLLTNLGKSMLGPKLLDRLRRTRYAV